MLFRSPADAGDPAGLRPLCRPGKAAAFRGAGHSLRPGRLLLGLEPAAPAGVSAADKAPANFGGRLPSDPEKNSEKL